MPNNPDTVNILATVLQSGIVVSGNSYINVSTQFVSGDALTSFRISGNTDLIALRLARSETSPLTGGTFTEIADHVEAHIFIHYPQATTIQARTTLITRVADFKVTVASGNFSSGSSGLQARPTFIGEEWSMSHEKQAKARLTYRFRYIQ